MCSRMPILAAGCIAMAHTTVALAQSTLSAPDYGLNWVTIGDPGNRGVLPGEVPDRPALAAQNLGAVDYQFRMTKTELTTRQWFEFVQAYSTVRPDLLGDHDLGGPRIGYDSSGWGMVGNPEQSTGVSWEFAARYCNWLHNGKALTREAFESGAYDTSTFTFNAPTDANHQVSRSPGALFWIPNLDEWIKGVHWDPAKYGSDQGGYWRYPGGQDTPLISGPPDAGGQTNAGPNGGPSTAGSYPDVNAPWGLLDTSGGTMELTETLAAPGRRDVRAVRGSFRSSITYEFAEPIDQTFDLFTDVRISTFAGVRIASAIPAPSAFVLSCVSGIFLMKRRLRCSHKILGEHLGSR